MTATVCTAKVGTDLAAIRLRARKDRRNATKRRVRRLARLTREQNSLIRTIEYTTLRAYSEKMALVRILMEIRQLSAN